MNKFKSEFLNIMHERGFYNQCTNEEGFDAYLYECESKGKPAHHHQWYNMSNVQAVAGRIRT